MNYIKFNMGENVISAFSTRNDGVSSGCFTSMNLSFSRGDRKENVLKNYELFFKLLDLPLENAVLSDQTHTSNILKVTNNHRGMGLYIKRSYRDIDGLFTNEKNIPLVTFHADCIPIYFYDPKKELIGIVHAGWRGTKSEIVKKMINIFIKHQSNINDIKVVIGPGICKSCFEVQDDVIKEMNFTFIKDCYIYKKNVDRYYLDLKEINKRILLNLGINEDNITVNNICTKCNPEVFFSHRYHGNKRGSQIGIIMLKEGSE